MAKSPSGRTNDAITSVAILLSTLVAACGAAEPGAVSEEDVAAIRESNRAIVEATRRADWDAVADEYGEDALLLPPGDPLLRGRDAIRAWMAGFPPLSAFDLETLEVEGRGDLAYVRGEYSLTLSTEAEGGGERGRDEGKFLQIRRKGADGAWRITVDIWNADGQSGSQDRSAVEEERPS